MKRICPALLMLAIVTPTNQAGTLARFRTVFGDIEVELYDKDKPVTVKNFVRYTQSGAWSNMFLHRCDPNFVIQGGGFYVANRGETSQVIKAVTTFGNITNEFGVGRRFSNVYGTIAMAKVAGDTNSANAQWFFNLNDNSFLDASDTNNLFTVFGHVVGGTNVLNVFKTFSGSSSVNTITNLGSPLSELPLLTTSATYNDLVYVDVTLLNVQVQSLDDGARQISWNSVSNEVNIVEFTMDFPPVWQTLTITNGDGDIIAVRDADAASTRRFYRVRVDY